MHIAYVIKKNNQHHIKCIKVMKIKASEVINLAETHVTVTHLSVCKHPKYRLRLFLSNKINKIRPRNSTSIITTL